MELNRFPGWAILMSCPFLPQLTSANHALHSSDLFFTTPFYQSPDSGPGGLPLEGWPKQIHENQDENQDEKEELCYCHHHYECHCHRRRRRRRHRHIIIVVIISSIIVSSLLII